MSSILNTPFVQRYVNAMHNFELVSAFETPWQKFNLRGVSVWDNIHDDDLIHETFKNAVFAAVFLSFTKAAGYLNLGLGALHFVTLMGKRDRQNFEKVSIRLMTAAYDLGIYYLFNATWVNAWIPVKGVMVCGIILFPTLVQKGHRYFYEQDENGGLKNGCLIKEWATGLADMVVPAVPKGFFERALALPYATIKWNGIAQPYSFVANMFAAKKPEPKRD